jgi:predicted Rossmann-fold nucleotide-binding protein
MQEIDTLAGFTAWLHAHHTLPAAFESLDLTAFTETIAQRQWQNSLFLGCKLSDLAAGHIVMTGGYVISNPDGALFEAHRSRLYSPRELFAGFNPNDPDGYHLTRDYQIYLQFKEQGGHRPESIFSSLMQRLHDHSITDALEETIAGRKIVAVMGGHGMERGDLFYLKVARLSRKLSQQGFLMVSGGGPGAMEATHLGAYFAGRSEAELLAAVDELKIRPPDSEPGREYADRDWLHRAWRIMEKYPIPAGAADISMSIGIPTWLYGHEPPAPFATHIAKYFANSVREEGLLAIADHGVVFAPGSAGTTQEIFQDATQNHYGSMGQISPMILFGVQHWTETVPVWDLLQKVSSGRRYGELLSLTDDEEQVISLILAYDASAYMV